MRNKAASGKMLTICRNFFSFFNLKNEVIITNEQNFSKNFFSSYFDLTKNFWNLHTNESKHKDILCKIQTIFCTCHVINLHKEKLNKNKQITWNIFHKNLLQKNDYNYISVIAIKWKKKAIIVRAALIWIHQLIKADHSQIIINSMFLSLAA